MPVKKSDSDYARALLIDAGPLVAAIDDRDRHHAWARRTLPNLPGRFLTCEAVVAEAMHLMGNSPRGVSALRGWVGRMKIVPMLSDQAGTVFDDLAAFAPQMDLADGCLVSFARRDARAVVVTTDTRGFSIFRVPFLAPEGYFAAQ